MGTLTFLEPNELQALNYLKQSPDVWYIMPPDGRPKTWSAN